MPVNIPEIIKLMETESTPFPVIKEVLAMGLELMQLRRRVAELESERAAMREFRKELQR